MLAQLHLQLIQLRRFVLAFCCRSVHLLGNRWKRYFTKQGLPLALCLLPGGSQRAWAFPADKLAVWVAVSASSIAVRFS